MWLSHYLHRGLLHPLLMRYSAKSTPLGIPLGGFFPNAIFSTFNALHISWAYYSSAWWTDPRFIIGTMLFVFGFLINRAADWKLRSLRKVGEGEGYKIPRGGLFELVSCPNYFGELVEWCGFALASWSPAGLCFALFGASTFIPRALSNHRWYQATFGDAYPTRRKAILPFIM
jgi:protein-S-isoprenylcysteine O-methyltransferase Ste14